MPVRFYICPIIGTGARRDAFRPSIADQPGVVTVAGAFARNPTTGAPVIPWALAVASAPDAVHVTLATLPNVTQLAGANIDAPLSAQMPAADVPALLARVAAQGPNVTGLDASSPTRALILAIGLHLDPAFTVDNLTVVG